MPTPLYLYLVIRKAQITMAADIKHILGDLTLSCDCTSPVVDVVGFIQLGCSETVFSSASCLNDRPKTRANNQ